MPPEPLKAWVPCPWEFLAWVIFFVRSAITFERRLLAVLGFEVGVGGVGTAAFQDVRGSRAGSAGEVDEDLMPLVELVLEVLRDSRGCDDCR